MEPQVDNSTASVEPSHSSCEADHGRQQPAEVTSSDPEVLRAALIREADERRRAECRAKMQTEVVQLALDLLVREPDIEGFFGVFTKTMVEETEKPRVRRLADRRRPSAVRSVDGVHVGSAVHAEERRLGHARVAAREHGGASLRLHAGMEPDGRCTRATIRVCPSRFANSTGARVCRSLVVAPLVLGSAHARMAGALHVPRSRSCDGRWRVVLLEAIARQAALALHQSRLAELSRLEERRKAILEERNRLARDIHDNLAQGFAAILMQLQAARREVGVSAARSRARASRRRSNSPVRT